MQNARIVRPATGLIALALMALSGEVAAQATSATGASTTPPVDAARITTEPRPTDDLRSERDIERVADAYRPKGVPMGDFLLFPKIELDQLYNSNLFAEERRERGDFQTVVRPEFALRSQLPVHEVNFLGQLEAYKHFKYDDDDRVDGFLEANGRYDITRTSELNGRLNLFARHEDRSSPDDERGRDPTPTRGFLSNIGTKGQVGSYLYGASFELDRRQYGDVDTVNGQRINNSDRDRWEIAGSVRGGYEFIPSYAAIVELSANQRTYDDTRDDLGFERSSRGLRAEAGISVDVSQLVRGDFLVGYLYQDYDDPRLSDPSGPSVRASLSWTPTKLTLVVPTLERTVLETTQIDVSSRVRTSATLLVRHEYARNILLSGYVGAHYDEYEGIDRTSWTYESLARITYALTPQFYVGGQVGFTSRDSELVDGSYDQFVIGLRVGWQL